jgi:tRNA pseudouridine55 synthase
MKTDLHGILLVDKPGRPDTPADADDAASAELPTSHDIVQRVRRWSRQRRIGHTGTLDPMASGLLVLCLGVATRLVEYYQGHDKTYEARVTLGRATDTYDAVGRTVMRSSIPPLTAADVEKALAAFRGQIAQKPPIYSALKQGGESLHRKARRGETVKVAPREVTFFELKLLSFAPPAQISLWIRCSAGAYVRSLAHALGQALGTVGHLSYLRRLEAGPFSVTDALNLPAIEKAAAGGLADLLLAPDAGLEMPRLTVSDEEKVRLGHGQKIAHSRALPAHLPPLPDARSSDGWQRAGLAAAYDRRGRFLGIARARAADGSADGTVWKAEKWLAQHLGSLS